jgi:hypothetical protein
MIVIDREQRVSRQADHGLVYLDIWRAMTPEAGAWRHHPHSDLTRHQWKFCELNPATDVIAFQFCCHAASSLPAATEQALP